MAKRATPFNGFRGDDPPSSEARTRLLIPGFHIGPDRSLFLEFGHWSARINQTKIISKRLTPFKNQQKPAQRRRSLQRDSNNQKASSGPPLTIATIARGPVTRPQNCRPCQASPARPVEPDAKAESPQNAT